MWVRWMWMLRLLHMRWRNGWCRRLWLRRWLLRRRMALLLQSGCCFCSSSVGFLQGLCVIIRGFWECHTVQWIRRNRRHCNRSGHRRSNRAWGRLHRGSRGRSSRRWVLTSKCRQGRSPPLTGHGLSFGCVAVAARHCFPATKGFLYVLL